MAFSLRASSIGSIPWAISKRLSVARLRASLRLISGYTPMACNRSFLSIQYRNRQYLLPLGWTSKNRPGVSESVSL
nr:MAG TPA: hypothetical protein [Caudoviricetes sp.]